MKSSKPSSPAWLLFVLCFSCSLLLPQAAWPQDFSSINNDLEQLESLIQDTLRNTEEQQRQLDDLKKHLDESGNLIETYENTINEREKLLKDLRSHLAELSEIYKTQSALSAKYERSSKFWKTFTLIAVPAAALLSGGIVFAAMQK